MAHEEMKQLAAVTAVNRMLASKYFDICTIDTVGKLLGVKPAGDAYNILHSMHCMHYAEMPSQLRDAIPTLIKDCLDVVTVFQFSSLRRGDVVELNTVTPQKPGLLKSLGFGK